MDFAELAQKRYSVRKFKSQNVEKEKLEAVLRAGQLAPTACNNQPQRILVAESAEALAKIKKCTPCHFDAPVVFVICYDSSVSAKRSADGFEIGTIDASIVTTHLMLQAADLGFGTTWVENFDPAAVTREFSLPDTIVPVALLPMGYPAGDACPSPRHADRMPPEKTVCFNTL